MTIYPHLDTCHADWKNILTTALDHMDKQYLQSLIDDKHWLPGSARMFAAFSLPLQHTRYILLGESPYPRVDSANGYAFWDSAVEQLWSPTGLSKPVNRATSLRNLIKMMLIARGDLTSGNTTQASIAQLNKESLIKTAEQLFTGMMNKGILLLNACLVYSEGKIPYHSRQWRPFMQSVFAQLAAIKPDIELILLGKIAETVPRSKLPIGLVAEHPYNISFITNHNVIEFFQPLDLLAL